MELTEEEENIYTDVASELSEYIRLYDGPDVYNSSVTQTKDFCVVFLERKSRPFCTIYLFHHKNKAHMFNWVITYSGNSNRAQAIDLKTPLIREGRKILERKGLLNEEDALKVIVTPTIDDDIDEAGDEISPYPGKSITQEEARKRLTNLTGLERRVGQGEGGYMSPARGTGFNQRRETKYRNETNEGILQIIQLTYQGRSIETLKEFDPDLAYELIERRLEEETIQRRILTRTNGKYPSVIPATTSPVKAPTKDVAYTSRTARQKTSPVKSLKKDTLYVSESSMTERQERLYRRDVDYYISRTTEQLERIVKATNPDAPDVGRLALRNRPLAAVLEIKGLVNPLIARGCIKEAVERNPDII